MGKQIFFSSGGDGTPNESAVGMWVKAVHFCT